MNSKDDINSDEEVSSITKSKLPLGIPRPSAPRQTIRKSKDYKESKDSDDDDLVSITTQRAVRFGYSSEAKSTRLNLSIPTSIENNTDFKKTSYLSGSNSLFSNRLSTSLDVKSAKKYSCSSSKAVVDVEQDSDEPDSESSYYDDNKGCGSY